MAKVEKDEPTGTETTGHEWDGIKELNTPLPKWWLYTFYATIIWAIGYTIAYPAWPLVSGATKGVLGYSSRAELAQSVVEARAAQSQFLDQISTKSLADIRADQALFEFALAGGKSVFGVNCSPCHGSGAQGAPGYPNLNDDDWLWGGSLEEIHTTLENGVRYVQNETTRDSIMPAFGRDELLTQEQIADTAQFVLSLSGKDHDQAAAERGKAVYAENCVACHGETGSGDKTQGAPALNDAIWLYGDTVDAITAQISNPRLGVMPAWSGRLNEPTIKQLAIYVHSLGGGQ